MIWDNKNKSYSIDTPKVVSDLWEKFSRSKKKSDNDKNDLNMIEHHSQITIDKHWEETMIHIIWCLTIISKKYLEINYSVEADPITVKIFESYL